jgi:hypothetical protein
MTLETPYRKDRRADAGGAGEMMNVHVTEDISMNGRVMAALTRMNEVERRIAIRRLRNENRRATLDACLGTLENPDEAVRISAAKVLSIAVPTPDVAGLLIKQLRSNPTAEVRSACARELARTESPEAADAVLAALDDTDEDVVLAACDYLARWGGRPAIEALLEMLAHQSWTVRLHACAGLMALDVCNVRVLSTLESLSDDPEAHTHNATVALRDAEVEETCGLMPIRERIGSTAELIDRARRIHSRTVRLAA